MNASVDVATGKIDFIDITIYCGFALLIDGFGLIPVVGEIISPLGIGGFRFFFWLKGINSSTMNWMMGVTGVSEVVPVVSEILPGCTAYVLTTCVSVMMDQKIAAAAPVARVIASSPMAPPQLRAGATAVAAAADIKQGQSPKEAVTKEAVGAIGGEAGVPGGGAAAASTATAGFESGAATTTSSGGVDFRGNFDFGSMSADSVSAAGAGEKKDRRSRDLAQSGKTPYAPGSPFVEGKPYADKSDREIQTTMREASSNYSAAWAEERKLAEQMKKSPGNKALQAQYQNAQNAKKWHSSRMNSHADELLRRDPKRDVNAEIL